MSKPTFCWACERCDAPRNTCEWSMYEHETRRRNLQNVFLWVYIFAHFKLHSFLTKKIETQQGSSFFNQYNSNFQKIIFVGSLTMTSLRKRL